MDAPCKNCRKRRPATKTQSGCHAGCQAYLVFWAANRKENEERLRQNELDNLTHKGMEKIKKARRLLRGKKHP